jgi:hypothetical protein
MLPPLFVVVILCNHPAERIHRSRRGIEAPSEVAPEIWDDDVMPFPAHSCTSGQVIWPQLKIDNVVEVCDTEHWRGVLGKETNVFVCCGSQTWLVKGL